MERFAIRFSYDGSLFYGWQKQPEARTVQGEIEKALSEIAKEKIVTIGSSRTDTGVHALSQYAHFDFPIRMTPRQVELALTTKLPKDIKILEAYLVNRDFHARFDACGRSYRFLITKELTPFNRLYHTYFPKLKIVPEKICEAVPLFLGSNDFELFSQKNPELETFISEIRHSGFREEGDGYVFEISADRFLHNMVRRIVGTLVRLSDNDEMLTIIHELLKEKNRKYQNLVYTAPPHGLYLTEVSYPLGMLSSTS